MIRAFAFTTAGQLQNQNLETSKIPAVLLDPGQFLWLDLEKPTKEETTAILQDLFHFHPLSIEDCVFPSPLPKIEEYKPGPDDKFAPYLFIIVHAVDYNRQDGVFATSELDFFLGKNFLVTCHDAPLRTVAAITERCVKGTLGPARAPDRVAHLLLDALVENYKPALDELAVEISEVEQRALEQPDKATLNCILKIKKEVLHLRRIIGPQRDVLARLAAGEFQLVRPKMVPYFRDVYDALFHTSELAHSYEDSLTGVLQIYLNMSSNQTGEVVKLLTLITIVTTPMMMIGTWYGMNFKDMPELDQPHAYVVATFAMLFSTGVTVWYFKKRNWF